ncbi:MAG: hypothetical protein AAGE01_24220 [Pseudomonadota bacterium]
MSKRNDELKPKNETEATPLDDEHVDPDSRRTRELRVQDLMAKRNPGELSPDQDRPRRGRIGGGS